MAKGYWIARVDVKDEEAYKPYAANNPGIFKKFGGRFVVRGGNTKAWRAPAARATWWSSFPIMRRLWLATGRRSIRRT